MEHGVWKTKSTLNSVYQHTLSAELQAVDQKVDQYFDNLFIGFSTKPAQLEL